VSCGAQTSPPLCFGFNDAAPPPMPPTVGVSHLGMLVHFTCPTSSTIDQVDLWVYPTVSFAIDILPTASLGGPLSGPVIGTYAVTVLSAAPGWQGALASVPATLVAGSTYALQIRSTPIIWTPNLCWHVSYDPLGPQQLPYQITPAQACVPAVPTAGNFGLIVRFRGDSCGTMPVAKVLSVGYSNGYPLTTLSSFVAPTLGLSNWPLTVSVYTPLNGTAYVFFANGTNALGSPIAAGSPCLHYLDPVSLTAYFQAGLEPLLMASIPPSVSSLTWTFPIPASAAFAGLAFGVEAAIVIPPGAPAAPIPLGGGLFGTTSNALMVTLGY
jgi:hypothetical protein